MQNIQDHYWNDTLLTLTLSDVQSEDLADFKNMLNEALEREGYPTITEFEFDGCEDINVKMSDETTHEICSETTMNELYNMIGI